MNTIKAKSVTITAIIAITILLGIALFKGIDGSLLAIGISTIAGLGGYALGKRRQ